ncbi:MAG: prealbumin-like fold domain-containing protein [Treponema sp.]|nr:prealbumin-like fold domain-containing protein [Treponema sp.]
MKRVILGLASVVLVLGLILAGCTAPTNPSDDLSRAAGNNGNNANSGNGNGNKGASADQTIYLKGSGSQFAWENWKNVFFVDGATMANQGWHLVYSGKNFNAITSMQITFTNGVVFNWTPDMGPSVNGGDNNMGWVIYAPDDYVIAYVNKGNNNESGSFLTTTESGNLNFNISGYKPGSGTPENPDTKGWISFVKKMAPEYDGYDFSDIIVNGQHASITIDAFEFDLYKAGVDDPVLTGIHPVNGIVKVTDLDPGEYYFKENLTSVLLPGADTTKLIVGPANPDYTDGIHFTISAAGGEGAWLNGFDGTLFNAVWCKHNQHIYRGEMWGPYQDSSRHLLVKKGGSYSHDASCRENEVLYLQCTECQFAVVIYFADTALGHNLYVADEKRDWVNDQPGPVVGLVIRCTQCYSTNFPIVPIAQAANWKEWLMDKNNWGADAWNYTEKLSFSPNRGYD